MGIYGKGMHRFIMRELELGYRAAVVEDEEVNAWWGLVPPSILDLQYQEYVNEHSV